MMAGSHSGASSSGLAVRPRWAWPLSDRLQLSDGGVYQLTERALLRWRPEMGQAEVANALELLSGLGYDEWLHAYRQIPLPTAVLTNGDSERSRQVRAQLADGPGVAGGLSRPAGRSRGVSVGPGCGDRPIRPAGPLRRVSAHSWPSASSELYSSIGLKPLPARPTTG